MGRVLIGLLFLLGVGCMGGGGGADRPLALSPDSLRTWMAEGRDVVLFDVRPDSLYVRQRLPLAVRAHRARVADLRDVIPSDPGVPLVIYNENGKRPPWEQDLGVDMIRYGFPHLFWLEGGIQAWIEQGYDTDGSRVFPRN